MPRPKAYKDTALLLAESDAAINKLARAHFKKMQERNPELKEFAFKPMNRCYKKSPVHFGRVCASIVDHMIINNAVGNTQRDIIKTVNVKFPEGKINPNVWHKKISPPTMKLLKVRIVGNTKSDIDVSGCRTLSDIKKALEAHNTKQISQAVCKGKIFINADGISVGLETFPYNERAGSQSIRINVNGKRQWLRKDALLMFLSNLSVKFLE